MAQAASNSLELSSATEIQRAEALKRFHLIRPFLQDHVPLPQIAAEHQVSLRTLRRWVKQYRRNGLSGLTRGTRKDQGQRRVVTTHLQQVIEGLALQKPRRTIANIYQKTTRICQEKNWISPSYSTVKRIIQHLDPALMTLVHEGAKAYQETYDLLYRHAARAPNEVWQSDHSLLPIFVLNEQGQPQKPWLTVILDDYSRAVAGYYVGFDSPNTERTALTLHQAIWRKTDPRWHVCGIPTRFYTDNGKDFTSQHVEQVAADLKMELIFSWPGKPRGRGKVERFFQTVEQLLLPRLPGFAGAPGTPTKPYLTLKEFDTHFQEWLLLEYHQRPQKEIHSTPLERWETGGFLPRLPESLEQLDLLLLQVRKKRRIQQDGIHFQGQRYFDVNLASFVGEDVLIRYDPRDLAVIRVFYKESFLCTAICSEFAGTQVSLKEVISARREERKRVRAGITQRLSVLEQVHQGRQAPPPAVPNKPKLKLKRYYNE